MSDGRITEVRDASDTIRVATTTDDRDQAYEALQHSPEEEAMIQAQRQTEPAPKADKSYPERVQEACVKYPGFSKIAFRESVPVYNGVLQIIHDHPRGTDLQWELSVNPKLARELSSMPVEMAMARAGEVLESLRQRGENPRRLAAFDGITK
jgi:hypothetical protein